MRRIALSVLTACGLAFLSACGGTGITNGSASTTPTQLVFSNGSGQINDFIVSPANTAPLTASQALSVAVLAESGSGPAALLVPQATFTWAARFVNSSDIASVQEYLTGTSPNGFKQCAFAATTPAIPIYYQPAGSSTLKVLPSGVSTPTVSIAPVAGVAAPVLHGVASDGVAGQHRRQRYGRRYQLTARCANPRKRRTALRFAVCFSRDERA